MMRFDPKRSCDAGDEIGSNGWLAGLASAQEHRPVCAHLGHRSAYFAHPKADFAFGS
jgi:hypothetical protein